MRHVYLTRGLKVVNVSASNSNVTISVQMEIYVEGKQFVDFASFLNLSKVAVLVRFVCLLNECKMFSRFSGFLEKIRGIEVVEPHGAMVGVPVKYKATAVMNNRLDEDDKTIHYVWNFNDFVSDS